MEKKVVICPFLVHVDEDGIGIHGGDTDRFELPAVNYPRIFLTLYITSGIADSLQVDWVRSGVGDLVELSSEILPTRDGTDELIMGPISGSAFSDKYSGPPLRYRTVVPAGVKLVVLLTNKSNLDILWRDLVSAVFEVPGG